MHREIGERAARGCAYAWRRVGVVIAVSVVAAWVGLLATTAQQPPGGGYLEPLPLDAKFSDRRVVRELETNKNKVISSKATDDAARETVRAYIQDYLVPWLTRPENFGQWHTIRLRLMRDLRLSQATPELHSYLANLVFAQMRPLVDQNFHPVIRVNAMLMIGDLNDREAAFGVQALPMASTLAFMREQVKNPAQIDAVRIAALAGILRHMESYWVADQPPASELINELTAEMTALALAAPPAGRSADVHHWIQARALDILGSLAGWQPQEQAFQAMQKMLADGTQPLWLRCRAAYALSRVKYAELANVDKVDWASVAAGLAGVLADACQTEQTYLEKQKEKAVTRQRASGVPGVPGMPPGGFTGPLPPGEPGGLAGGGAVGLPPPPPGEADAAGGFGFPASGMGMMPFGPLGSGSLLDGLPKHKVDASRRRLLYELACVKAALRGPTPTADLKGINPLAESHPAAGPMLRTIETVIAEVEKTMTAKDIDIQAVLKTLRTRGQEVQQLRPQVPHPSTPDSDVLPSDVPPSDVPPAGTP